MVPTPGSVSEPGQPGRQAADTAVTRGPQQQPCPEKEGAVPAASRAQASKRRSTHHFALQWCCYEHSCWWPAEARAAWWSCWYACWHHCCCTQSPAASSRPSAWKVWGHHKACPALLPNNLHAICVLCKALVPRAGTAALPTARCCRRRRCCRGVGARPRELGHRRLGLGLLLPSCGFNQGLAVDFGRYEVSRGRARPVEQSLQVQQSGTTARSMACRPQHQATAAAQPGPGRLVAGWRDGQRQSKPRLTCQASWCGRR
jgi:hypothetical protein